MAKITLSPAEEQALTVGCPLCSAPKGKKCHSKSDKLISRPHRERIDQGKDVAEMKTKHPRQWRHRNPVAHGFVVDGNNIVTI